MQRNLNFPEEMEEIGGGEMRGVSVVIRQLPFIYTSTCSGKKHLLIQSSLKGCQSYICGGEIFLLFS